MRSSFCSTDNVQDLIVAAILSLTARSELQGRLISDFIRRLLVTETFVLGLVSPGEGSTIVRYRAHSRRVFTKHDHRLRTLSLILQKKIGGIYNVQGGSSTPLSGVYIQCSERQPDPCGAIGYPQL